MEDSNSAYIKNFETKYTAEYMATAGFNPEELLAELDAAHEINAYKAEKAANFLQDRLIETKDIDHLIDLLAKKAAWSKDTLVFGQGCRDALAALASDRVLRKMVDSVKFGKVKPTESLRRLATLRSLAAGNCYFDKTWGYGVVKRVDTFDMRVFIDFDGKPGHSMSFEYAAEALRTVPESHMLARRHANPGEFAEKVNHHPGEIVRAAIESFGPSSVGRLQMLLASYGVVDEAGWRKFWTKARADLSRPSKDGVRVVIPSKRSDPLTIVAGGERREFDDDWFGELKKKRDIQEIFDAVSSFEDYERKNTTSDGKPARSEFASSVLTDRLLFAIKGAFLFPPPMFTRLVLMAQRLGIETSNDELAEMLLDEDRFMVAGDKIGRASCRERV